MRRVIAVLLVVVALVSAGFQEHSRAVASATASITFVVGLRMDEAGLELSVRDGGRLTAAEIGSRFGISLRAEKRVMRVLRGHGIQVVATYPQRSEILARAKVATLERYLHIRYRERETAAGIRYLAPTQTAAVPADLRPWVDVVAGLSTEPLGTAHTIRSIGMADARTAYDVAPLYSAGVRGGRAPIAVLGFADFVDNDVLAFDRLNHLPSTLPRRIPRQAIASSNNIVEPDLDVEVIHEIAPAARTIFYTGAGTVAGWTAMFSRFVRGPATIGSLSWGFCDDQWPLNDPDRVSFDKALHAIAAAGKTLFVASGDHGAYDCQESDFANHSLTVDFPSDSADVVSVGGTLLGVRDDGSYVGEDAWVEPLSNAGGGGGFSPAVPRPAWQDSFVTGLHRGVPDVAASASGGSAWRVVVGGRSSGVGGTSAAAPFWAAAMLLVQEYAAGQGVQARCFLAPLLYGVFGMQQPYRYAFHDVRYGTNRFYAAKTGWDGATGLGSPDVWNLARDLVAYLRQNPNTCRS